MPQRILVVDDEASIRESLADALTNSETTIQTAADGSRALKLVEEFSPDVVLADVRMPGLDGLELLRAIRRLAPDTAVVLMTAFDDMPTVAAAMRDGAVNFLVKPLDLHELRRVLARMFEDRRTRTQMPTAGLSSGPSPALVGRDPKMIEIYKAIGQMAATRTTVLIRGESGTGKELIARAIHEQSSSAVQPFVAVNCSALPSTLLESELFGHTRGAFTGAVNNRRGRFALAGRGTIFLDEIGDTTLDFQSKLLRVLQEHEFQPVGADHSEKTEARVIAATHRHLEDMVAASQFREDLYYRLRVIEIAVPPLRERLGDLPLLVDHLVARTCEASGRSALVVAPETMDAIRRHSWPGNIRELENCIRRAIALASGDVVRPEHLGIGIVASEARDRLPSLADVERDHVARVLAATGRHKAKAATILGVSRPRLNRLLKQYGLE